MFKNREEAGKKLAEVLFPFKNENPLVLAIPRGGVQVGYHVANCTPFIFPLLLKLEVLGCTFRHVKFDF